MKFLNEDERDALAQLSESPDTMKALYRVLEHCVLGREMDVIKLDLSLASDIPSQIQKLALTKARAEGARSVVADFRRSLDAFKAAELKAVKAISKAE